MTARIGQVFTVAHVGLHSVLCTALLLINARVVEREWRSLFQVDRSHLQARFNYIAIWHLVTIHIQSSRLLRQMHFLSILFVIAVMSTLGDCKGFSCTTCIMEMNFETISTVQQIKSIRLVLYLVTDFYL